MPLAPPAVGFDVETGVPDPGQVAEAESRPQPRISALRADWLPVAQGSLFWRGDDPTGEGAPGSRSEQRVFEPGAVRVVHTAAPLARPWWPRFPWVHCAASQNITTALRAGCPVIPRHPGRQRNREGKSHGQKVVPLMQGPRRPGFQGERPLPPGCCHISTSR